MGGEPDSGLQTLVNGEGRPNQERGLGRIRPDAFGPGGLPWGMADPDTSWERHGFRVSLPAAQREGTPLASNLRRRPSPEGGKGYRDRHRGRATLWIAQPEA